MSTLDPKTKENQVIARSSSLEQKRKRESLDALYLFGAIITGLTAVANLVIFLVLGTTQLIVISLGSILFAVIFLVCRNLLARNHDLFSAVIASISWAGYFLLHEYYWGGFIVVFVIGMIIIPIHISFNLPKNSKRILVRIPVLISAIVMIFMTLKPAITQLTTSDLALITFAIPTYVGIFGILLFLVVLRLLQTRRLYTRMMVSLIVLVFIPIAVLSFVSYYNAKTGDTEAAVTTLNQISQKRFEEILSWSNDQTVRLASPLEREESFTRIIDLLSQHDAESLNDDSRVAVVSGYLETLLPATNFSEISIMDDKGFVVATTNENNLGRDYGFIEFFWRGKISNAIIPPRNYTEANEIFMFISRPIRNPSGEIVGVLSGRLNMDAVLSIAQKSFLENFATGQATLVNINGSSLASPQGESISTASVQQLITTLSDGYQAYRNDAGIPVIGYFRWIPDLGIGLVIEATQEEVYQRLPGIVATNITIGLIAFFLAAMASGFLVRSITQPIDRLVRTSEEVVAGNLEAHAEVTSTDEVGSLALAFNKMTEELRTIVENLENRVSERTKDLQKRSNEIQIAAQIARDVSLAGSVDDLLERTSNLIRDRFGFYHVGIFLNDSKNEFAVLHAAAGDAGQLMLASNHKLALGEVGIVGHVGKSGEARIALDVGTDAVHFRNPLLPYTRSEMALPIKIGSRILGVLDVQSDKMNAFDENDIAIMEILTDQLATGIEKLHLLNESNENALALEKAYQSQTASAWQEFLNRSKKLIGYRYSGVHVLPVEKEYITQIASMSMTEQDRPHIVADPSNPSGTLAILPVQVRGEILGKLTLRFSTSPLPKETIQLIEEVTNRLSMALENARLLQDARDRADRERVVGSISARLHETLDLETILKTAAKEIQNSFGLEKAEVRLQSISPTDMVANQGGNL